MYNIHVCIYLLLCLNFNFAKAASKHDYTEVLEEIFTTNGYNKRVLPQENTDYPIELELTFNLLGINEIDEISEKMITTGYLYISWVDPGLSWEPTDHNGIQHIFLTQNDIWTPDLYLRNGFKKLTELGGSYYYIEVDHDGTTHWFPFEVFESRCSLDTRYYPFDEQKCDIAFVVWSHSLQEVEIKSTDGLFYSDLFQQNSVWNIRSVTYTIRTDTTESHIIFTFNLKRKPLYYIVNILLPVVFLGFLNGLVFVIPAETGEKTGFSVTVFLSLAVFLTIISAILPVNSEKVSILGIYLLLQVVIGVCVLTVSTIQLRLNARSSAEPVTGVYLKLVQYKLKCCCGLRKGKHSSKIAVITQNKGNGYLDAEPVLNDISWRDVVSAIDVVGLWLFIITYTMLTALMFIYLYVQ